VEVGDPGGPSSSDASVENDKMPFSLIIERRSALEKRRREIVEKNGLPDGTMTRLFSYRGHEF
jgi:hypothetical protein